MSWKDNPLKYGSFDGERERVLNDLESGTLSVIVGGHSHRNVIMKVDKGRAEVIGSGSTFGTIETVPEKLALVTSSCGPLPKYIPGGPLICGCTGDNQRYETGWDFRDGKLYEYKNIDKDGNISHLTTRHEVEGTGCTACGMSAKKMVRKQARRHRPGGNLLAFDKKLVKIKSVFSSEASSEPRPGVICDELAVFTGTMKLEHIENENDFKKWEKIDPITIISRTPFVKYGYMEIPNQVEYVTYLSGALGGYNSVCEEKVGENRVRVRQLIGKDAFDELMKSAQRKNDFAFVSYRFGSNKYSHWQREIKMYKEMEMLKTFNVSSRDPFKGLVIKFLRKPDLEKRVKLCGY